MILTVDPGVNAAGFALWYGPPHWATTEIHLPAMAFVLRAAAGLDDWTLRIADIMEQLDAILAGHLVTAVWSEFPILFGGAGGHAASRRGDTYHLAAAVGSIGEWARQRQATFHAVDVNAWIGQLPKPVMQSRVEQLLLRHNRPQSVKRLLQEPSHHWDAIGVGLHAQGFWP